MHNKESKGSDVSYSSHSTQINLYDCTSEKDFNFILLQKKIPEEAIYREYPQVEKEYFINFLGTYKSDDPRESYGLESVPHVTVLYGLENQIDYFDLRDKLKNFGSIEFEIGKIKSFRSEGNPYDVLVLEIISPRLVELHKFVRENYDNTYNFPEYVPHMTLCYVTKGSLKDMEGPCSWTGTKYMCSMVRFSHKDKYYLDIPLE